MPDDASGNFSLVSGYLAQTGTTIQPSQHNPPLEDIAPALTARLSRSGVAPMTGPLKTITGSSLSPAIYPNSNPAIGIYWTPTGIAFAGTVSGIRFIGELIPYTLLSAPALTVFPYGQTLLRSSYPDLWTLVQAEIAAGNVFYNNGNGSTTFGIGDLRGRVVAGKDNMGGSSAGRLNSSSGMSPDGQTLGGAGGVQMVALTEANNGAHIHANSLVDPGHAHNYSTPIFAGLNSSTGATVLPRDPGTSNGTTTTNQTGISITNASSGSGTPHVNIQPTMVCNYLLYAGA